LLRKQSALCEQQALIDFDKCTEHFSLNKVAFGRVPYGLADWILSARNQKCE